MRERYREIETRGVPLILVICQSEASVRAFCGRHPIPFAIAIDESRDTARSWGVWRLLGLDAVNIARPATFLVDGAGIIRERHVAPVQWRPLPIDALLEGLDRIGAPDTLASGGRPDRERDPDGGATG